MLKIKKLMPFSQPSHRSRRIIIILIFLFTFVISNTDFTKNTVNNLSASQHLSFPENINGWSGQNLKIEKTNRLFKIMSAKEIILRLYKKSDNKNKINLTLVLADNKSKVHDPKICYKLQGFEFLDKKIIKLAPDLNVNFIKTKKANKEYLFIYWYTDLEANYATRIESWKEIIFKKLVGKPIKAYGIVILYTPVENTENLKKFALEVNKILFTRIKK